MPRNLGEPPTYMHVLPAVFVYIRPNPQEQHKYERDDRTVLHNFVSSNKLCEIRLFAGWRRLQREAQCKVS